MEKTEENFLSKALRIISEGLPQFFTETNTPFLGKDEEKSVMKPASKGQQEKEVLELLLGGGAALATGGKTAIKVASKYPTASSVALALGLQDPTALLSGPVGVADAVSSLTGGGGSIKDAEATIVPANLLKSATVIDNALAMLKSGINPKQVYKATGVYEGPLDKIPRSVISDKDAKLMQSSTKDPKDWVLGDILDHKELYDKIPKLKNIKTTHLTDEEIKQGYKAAYLPAHDGNPAQIKFSPAIKTADELISSLLHESQHAIQTDFGFVAGSNPSLSKDHPKFISLFNEARATNPLMPREDLAKMIQKQVYQNAGGEAESDAVQRMKAFGDAGMEDAYTGYPLDFYRAKEDKLLYPAPDLAYMRGKAQQKNSERAMQGAFRSSNDTMLSRDTIEDILYLKEDPNLNRFSAWDTYVPHNSLLLSKLSSKEVAKYGTPEFVLDKYLTSTVLHDGRAPGTIKEIDLPALLDSNNVRELKAVNESIAEIEKSGKRYSRLDNAVKNLQRGVLNAGTLVEDYNLSTKQGKKLLRDNTGMAMDDVGRGIVRLNEKLIELGITKEEFQDKSLQQIKSLVNKKEEETIKILKKSQDKKVEIISNRTKELASSQRGAEDGFVRLVEDKDLAHETDILNHCIGAVNRCNDKYIPAFDTVTGKLNKAKDTNSFKDYKDMLESGDSEFYSYRPKGMPEFTIRVDRTLGVGNEGLVVQAHGFEDANLTKEQLNALKKFGKETGYDTTLIEKRHIPPGELHQDEDLGIVNLNLIDNDNPFGIVGDGPF